MHTLEANYPAKEAFSAAAIGAYLPERPAELLRYFDSIDSTNTYLKQTPGLPHGTAAVADSQSGGRGRRGRQFESAGGQGIYLSVVWQASLFPGDLLSLTALGAVAACNAVETVCGVRPGIKWTNDLVLQGKKICGILTEMTSRSDGRIDRIVMGIGLNVCQTAEDFSPEVAELASSLEALLGRSISRARLAAELISEFDRLFTAAKTEYDAYLAAYRRDCITLGKPVRLLWRETQQEALALDVDEQFGLVVQYADGRQETVRSGEVSVRGLYGYTE